MSCEVILYFQKPAVLVSPTPARMVEFALPLSHLPLQMTLSSVTVLGQNLKAPHVIGEF